MEVLDRIDELRKQRGWSVNNLAMEAMLTQSTLNNLYVRRAEPKLSTLRAICAAFGISLAEFYSGIDADTLDDDQIRLLELFEKIPVSKRKIVFDFLSVIAEEASQK